MAALGTILRDACCARSYRFRLIQAAGCVPSYSRRASGTAGGPAASCGCCSGF